MRGKRIFWFLVMVALGTVLGLIYGWMISPAKSADTSLDALRSDYKADYVLMTAETYHADQNLEQATRRLGLLDTQPPGQLVTQAIRSARELGYPAADMQLMDQLLLALQGPTAVPSSGGQP